MVASLQSNGKFHFFYFVKGWGFVRGGEIEVRGARTSTPLFCSYFRLETMLINGWKFYLCTGEHRQRVTHDLIPAEGLACYGTIVKFVKNTRTGNNQDWSW